MQAGRIKITFLSCAKNLQILTSLSERLRFDHRTCKALHQGEPQLQFYQVDRMRSLQRSFQISDCCCTTSRPSTRLQPCVTSIGKGELLRTCIAAHRAWLQVLTPRSQRRKSVLIRAGLRIVETYDASFDLAKESHETLESLLSSPTFCKQVPLSSLLVSAKLSCR